MDDSDATNEHGSSPTAVELDRRRSLTVTWPDGLRAAFALDDLRENCPCAECRGRREQGLPIGPRPGIDDPVEAVAAELVGAWGVTIRWSDGHDTGIYAWERLRHWAAAPAPDDADQTGEST